MRVFRFFLFSLTVISLTSTPISSQDSFIKNRLNFKLGYSKQPAFLDWETRPNLGNIRIETNYGIFNYLEAGCYFGYDRFTNLEWYISGTSGITRFTTYKSDALFYGLNANFHVLPFLLKNKDLRLDMYISGKLGLISIIAPKNSLFNGHTFDYGLFVGSAYYFGKHWGAFTEYGYIKKVLESGKSTNLRYGLTLKF